jgi:hypothetical protein
MNSWLDVPLNVLTVAPTVDEDELLPDDMSDVYCSKVVSLW